MIEGTLRINGKQIQQTLNVNNNKSLGRIEEYAIFYTSWMKRAVYLKTKPFSAHLTLIWMPYSHSVCMQNKQKPGRRDCQNYSHCFNWSFCCTIWSNDTPQFGPSHTLIDLEIFCCSVNNACYNPLCVK